MSWTPANQKALLKKTKRVHLKNEGEKCAASSLRKGIKVKIFVQENGIYSRRQKMEESRVIPTVWSSGNPWTISTTLEYNLSQPLWINFPTSVEPSDETFPVILTASPFPPAHTPYFTLPLILPTPSHHFSIPSCLLASFLLHLLAFDMTTVAWSR